MHQDIAGTAWRFERGDGTVLAKVVLLLHDGTIGGYINANLRRWVVRDGLLRILDVNGVVTTTFDEVVGDDGSVRRLVGPARFDPAVIHVLERIEMPSHFDLGQRSQETQADFLTRLPAPKRTNLVVLRANSDSLHTSWPRNIDDSDRTWDLCISWYDDDLGHDLGPHEYLSHQSVDRKFGSIYALFRPGSPLWNYNQIWMPDDDLMTSWRDINRLFEVCQRHKLQLAQPSLRQGSHAGLPITLQKPELALRFSEYVEGMCPVFSVDALRVCIETFKGSISGWGLDFLWSLLLGHVASRVAIIDEISVIHARPVAANYDAAAAAREFEGIMDLYGATLPHAPVGNLVRADAVLL